MNAFDYLTWRGDVPFSADPFNEVDGLILSLLAYTDFGAIVPAEGEISLQEAAATFFGRFPREVVEARSGFTAPAPLMMEEMAAGARFRNTVLADYINVVDKDNTEQLSAVSFLLEDGSLFVAFRGTDSSLTGWKEDLAFSYLSETAGQKRAVSYLEREAASFSGKIRVGGHSKGGNFAVYAASFCERAAQEKISVVYSYDGPGFRDEILRTDGYTRILSRIRHIVPEASFFGMLMADRAEPIVIKSTASGFVQHDGFTWQIVRNRFERGELTETALMMEKTFDGWLEEMDDGERESLFDTVFSLLEATGEESIKGVFSKKLRSADAVFDSLRGLPKDKRKEMLSLLGRLLQTGGRNAVSTVASVTAANLPGKKGGDKANKKSGE